MNKEKLIDFLNQSKLDHQITIEDIRFECTSKGLNRRVDVKFTGDNHYCSIKVFSDRTNEYHVSVPTYFMGDQNTNEAKHRILKYLFLRYWIWIKNADGVFTYLKNELGFSTEQALNIIGDVFQRQFPEDDCYTIEMILTMYKKDCEDGLYKFSNNIEFLDNYVYLYKDIEELKSTNPLIVF